MQCVILAGGLATRLKPITEKIPKAMVPVNGRPFLEYQLELLRKNGIDDIVLCVGYLADRIVSYFGDGSAFDVNLRYSYEHDELLGTGGAIRNALSMLNERFFVLYGDSYLDIVYAYVCREYEKKNCPAMLVVYQNEGRWDTSNVVFVDGWVRVYNKTRPVQQMRYIDYGLSILSRSLFENMPAIQKWDLSVLYTALAADGKMAGFEVHKRFYEIGSKNGLREFSEIVAAGGQVKR